MECLYIQVGHLENTVTNPRSSFPCCRLCRPAYLATRTSKYSLKVSLIESPIEYRVSREDVDMKPFDSRFVNDLVRSTMLPGYTRKRLLYTDENAVRESQRSLVRHRLVKVH